MARSSKTQFTILGMLSIEPMSGYEIKQAIAESTAHFWAESDGQIYPALNRLTESGLIHCLEKPSGARLKKIYTLTSGGEAALQEWLARDVERSVIRHELLLKLFFGRKTSKKVLLHHISHFKSNIEKKLLQFDKIIAELKEKYSISVELKY